MRRPQKGKGDEGGIASPPPNSCACVLCEKRVGIGERGAAECHRVTACLCFLTRRPGPASASGAPQTQMSQQREYIGCLICILCTSFLGALDIVASFSLADLKEDFLFEGDMFLNEAVAPREMSTGTLKTNLSESDLHQDQTLSNVLCFRLSLSKDNDL